jgi:hypothetical protein
MKVRVSALCEEEAVWVVFYNDDEEIGMKVPLNGARALRDMLSDCIRFVENQYDPEKALGIDRVQD